MKRLLILVAVVALFGCEPNAVKQYIVLATDYCRGDDAAGEALVAAGYELPDCRE